MYRLSPMQEGMLFHCVSAAEEGTYVGQATCPLPLTLDVPAFKRAWQQVVARHAVLRTSFEWERRAYPVQHVHDGVSAAIEHRDWRRLEAEAEERELETDRHRPLDLRVPPVMRLSLCRRPGDYLFVWTHHHLLLDGRARAIVLKEVARLYDAFECGLGAELSSPPSYHDYVEWLAAQRSDALAERWAALLGTFRPAMPLALVDDEGGRGFGRQQVPVSPALAAAVQRTARELGVTAGMIVQCAWAVLLSRYGGQEDVVFGVTRSCRRSGFAMAPAVVGVVMNTLPHRLQAREDRPIATLVRDLRAQHVAAREHQHASLARIRALSGVPHDRAPFDSLVVLEEHDLGDTLRAERCGLWSGGIRRTVYTHYGLTLAGYVRPVLSLDVAFRRRMFDEAAVTRMARHLATLLEAIAGHPEARCGDLPMLTPDDIPPASGTSTHPKAAASGRVLLPALFEAQVARTPEAAAVIADGETLTFRALNERANRLAHLLMAEGIGPETLVGLALPRSLEAVVALIAILKAGGAYVPLDPDYPEERLAFVLDDAGAACVLTMAIVPFAAAGRCRRIRLDDPAVQSRLARSSPSNPDVALDPEHAAYCIYTSGSTGTPKGVVVPHRAIANKIRTLVEYLRVGRSTRFAATSSISFDPLLDQVFLPLCAGGACVVVPDGVRDEPRRFADYATRTGISMLNGTPALVDRLLREGPLRVDTLIAGADTLQPALADALRTRGAARRILNFYGPTETCINASGYELDESGSRRTVPIGRALPTYRLSVLTPSLQPLPLQAVGELFIGGPGVARGYLRRPGTTAERFLPDPFADAGARMYRTGDRVKWRADGNLEFLGRWDRQVKVRGFRVEPGEIEHALTRHPAVLQAVVAAQPATSGDVGLVAYVVPHDGGSPPVADDLRAWLRRSLPHHMVPSAFVPIERIPLTPNGKVDRAALPAASLQPAHAATASAPPATELQQIIASIWTEVLDIPRLGSSDNFFDLGGHSLSAMRVVSRIRDRLHVDVPVRLVFDAATLADLAESIERLRQTAGASTG